MHYSGMFIYEPCTVYVKGRLHEIDWDFDLDELSYIEFTNEVERFGFKHF